MSNIRLIASLAVAGALLSGCGAGKLLAERDETIAMKDQELAAMRAELDNSKKMASEENARVAGELKRTFADLEREKKLRLQGNRIIMPSAVLFTSGSVEISAEGRKVLDEISSGLGKYASREILVEGHTDAVPIARKAQDRFKSNWELSSARAITVLHYLRNKPTGKNVRFGAVALADSRPVGDNNTEEGRARNRRVVVVVGPAG